MNRHTMERIDAALEGKLDAAEFEALQEELRQDPVALDHWCHQAAIHGRLEWELADQAVPFSPLAPSEARPAFFRWAAAAALVLAGLGLGLLIGRGKPAAQGGSPVVLQVGETVGRITATRDPQWVGTALATGDWVQTGTLELRSGSAVITFDCGATVRLKAPARLHVTSPTRTLMESGKATVEIPRQAYGFVFETPSTEISRRMSRFAVAVDDDGHSEIHVLDGQIQLAGKLGDLDTLNLGKNKAVRLAEDGKVMSATRYQVDQLTTSLPESADLLPEWYLHWGFDTTDTNSGTFRETGIHPELAERFDAQVHLPHADSVVSLVPGRFGNAVHMNGQRGFLATDFPGFSGASPRSIAFWIRIPPDTPENLAYSFLSWGTKDVQGGKWQMGWNTGNDNAGVVGAIRTEVQGGYHIGSTDLRTGRWHHIVSVFSGGQGADVTSHVRHYVDGRLDPTTAVLSKAVDTRTSGETSLPLTLGRRIEAADGFYRTFSGELDEVFLFPTALTPEQIEQLYRENHPPGLRR